MVYIALTRIIMPVRRTIMTKSDYQKIHLSWLWLKTPGDGSTSGIVRDTVIGFEPKYITRLLAEDEVMAMKLIASQIYNEKLPFRQTGYHTSSPDAVIFKTTQKEYDKFLKEWQVHQVLVQQQVSPGFDYDELKRDMKLIASMAAEKKCLKEISRQMTRSGKKMKAVIRTHNVGVGKSQTNLSEYFQNKFKIEDMFVF